MEDHVVTGRRAAPASAPVIESPDPVKVEQAVVDAETLVLRKAAAEFGVPTDTLIAALVVLVQHPKVVEAIAQRFVPYYILRPDATSNLARLEAGLRVHNADVMKTRQERA